MLKTPQPTSHTLVIQSHCQPLPHAWLAACIESVKKWTIQENIDYLFLGNEIFDTVPDWVLEKTRSQKVIATDLARLKCLQYFLSAGYQRVVWLDADFLIFAPKEFKLPELEQLPEHYTLGREVWVQPKNTERDSHKSKAIKFKAYTKVHNAFLLFDAQFAQRNSFLDFYAAHAERLLKKVSGPLYGALSSDEGEASIPPQFIGPKLLTALHNIVQCPVQENAGMLSPWVISDLLAGGGPALELFRNKSPQPLAGANLCNSLADSDALPDRAFEKLVAHLLSQAEI